MRGVTLLETAMIPCGPIAQRQSRGLIIPWLQVRILLGPVEEAPLVSTVEMRMSRYDDDDDDDDDFDDIRRHSRSRRRHRFDDDIDVSESKRLAAGLCGILVGGLGIHKFVLGYGLEGAILLSMSLGGIVIGTIGVFTAAFCCIPIVLGIFYILPLISSTIGLIEGIIYITKSDEEFIELYQMGQRTWF